METLPKWALSGAWTTYPSWWRQEPALFEAFHYAASHRIIARYTGGWITISRWKICVTHAKPAAGDTEEYDFVLRVEPVLLPGDKRSAFEVWVRVGGYYGISRERGAVLFAYLEAEARYATACCARHALIGEYDGSPCLQEEPPT